MSRSRIGRFILGFLLSVLVTPVASFGEVLTFSFVGDIMAHTVNFEMPDYDRIYDSLRDLLSQDHASFANLEFPIDETAPYATYPRFNVHRPYVEAAIRGGFDVFSLANNHSTDRFARGVLETLDAASALSEAYGVRFSGLRKDAGAPWELEILEIEGARVGFVAFTAFLNDPWNGAELVYLADYRVAASRSALLQAVEAWDAECDVLIVSYHAGVEYVVDPDPGKAAFLREMVAAGADVVWAHHPHVLQPWDLVTGPDGGEKLVLYSLGNFIAGQTWRLSAGDYRRRRAFTGDTAVVQVRLHADPKRSTVLGVAPQLVTTVNDRTAGPVVRPLPEVATDHPEEAWRRFFYFRARAVGPYPSGGQMRVE
jgi:poly-gamma-glutamate capsule biosynthesis protein CapA/YwtB (metallophosphatase superfamily)